MIKVLYFARLREDLNIGSESMDAVRDLDSLCKVLSARGDEWAENFGENQMLLMSVNQEMADLSTQLTDGDEVAFFPPVTGG
ncbi:MAG: MoaD/ThiS family protein [Gammaproteobacteria bacterium]|nr:MoaD/ThiS family protein [Gammaproteobacteria bacterium]